MQSLPFDQISTAPAWLSVLALAGLALAGLVFIALCVAALAYFKGRRAAWIGAGVLLAGGGVLSVCAGAVLYFVLADPTPAESVPASPSSAPRSPLEVAQETAQLEFNRAEFGASSASFARARELDAKAPITLTEISAHLLAHRTHEAAQAAELYAKTAKLTPQKTGLATCLAAALASRDGNAEAQQRLLAQTSVDGAPILCGVLATDLESDKRAKQRRLDHLLDYRGDPAKMVDFDRLLISYLNAEARGREKLLSHYRMGLAALNPESVLLLEPLAVVNSIGVTAPEDLRIEAHTALAVAHSWLGEHRSAAAELGHVLRLTAGGGTVQNASTEEDAFGYQNGSYLGAASGFVREERSREGLFLASMLALRAGFAAQAERYQAMNADESWGASKLRPYQHLLETGGASGAGALTDEDSTRPNWDLWKRVANQDAAGLVALLVERRHTGSGLFPWLGKWNRVELTHWLHNGFPKPKGDRGFHDVLRHTAARREAARALEDRALEAELAPIAERLLKAWLDREVAVPLYVLARLANF
jgi:hypothetical protein